MSQSKYFYNLDALRSVAALMVLFAHLISGFFSKYLPEALWVNNPVAQFIFSNGGFGVRIFFVLSGYLITYLLLSEKEKNGSIKLKNFYIRRVLRIWPVYFLVLFFVFVIYAFIKQKLGFDSPIHENLFMSVSFLSNFDLINILSSDTKFSNGMLSLTWSVSVEEQFYLIWPLIILIPKRNLLVSILIIICTGICFMFLNFDNRDVVYHHTVSNFVFLGIGGLLAYLKVNNIASKNLRKLSKTGWKIILILLLTILIFFKQRALSYQYGYVMYLLASAAFLFLLLYNLVENPNKIFDIKKTNPIRTIAKYSYGIYMYHRIVEFMINTLFFKVFKVESDLFSDAIIMIIQVFMTFALAIASYKFIESPILQYKKKFY